MKLFAAFNNLARGKLDHDTQGRFDIQAYGNSADVIENFFTDVKGNGIYSSGFEAMIEFEDCAFIEFKFSINQNYVLVLYNTKMRFLSYDVSDTFGWVLDGSSNILEIDTPWSLAESKHIAKTQSTTQNSDYMIITHQSHEPRKLVRLSANSFTLSKDSRKDDPFPTTFAAAKTITAITLAANAQITVTSHGYSAGDRVRISGVAGMTQINDWTVAIVSIVDVNNFIVDLDTTGFTAYGSGGSAQEVTAGNYPSRCLFYNNRLWYANTPNAITTLWGSEQGQYGIYTLPSSVVATSALRLALAEISQPIESLFAGENSLIVLAGDGIIAVNGGEVGRAITAETVDSILTVADASSFVAPIRSNSFIFYVGVERRNLYYFRYSLLTESFESTDANFSSIEYTRGFIKKMRRVNDIFDIVYLLNDNGELATLKIDLRQDINVLAWHKRTTNGTFEDIAQITNNQGTPELITLTKRGNTYWIERKAPHVEFKYQSDFYTGDKQADKVAYWRYSAELLQNCNYLDNSRKQSDLRTSTITYNSGAGTITDAAAGFVIGDVGKQIVYKTTTGYEYGRFEIVAYNSSTSVDVNVLVEPTADIYNSWYLTTNVLSGLARFNGQIVSVHANGGYLGDYEVSGGQIILSRQITSAIIGYKYRGVIKSFPMGYVIQQYNTHVTPKRVVAAHARFTMSAGGKFSTDGYVTESFQKINIGQINYAPSFPMDETISLLFDDTHDINKSWYIIQDEPSPLTLNAVIIESDQAVTT